MAGYRLRQSVFTLKLYSHIYAHGIPIFPPLEWRYAAITLSNWHRISVTCSCIHMCATQMLQTALQNCVTPGFHGELNLGKLDMTQHLDYHVFAILYLQQWLIYSMQLFFIFFLRAKKEFYFTITRLLLLNVDTWHFLLVHISYLLKAFDKLMNRILIALTGSSTGVMTRLNIAAKIYQSK